MLKIYYADLYGKGINDYGIETAVVLAHTFQQAVEIFDSLVLEKGIDHTRSFNEDDIIEKEINQSGVVTIVSWID